MRVSVIVPVRDDRARLELLIQALQNQTLPRSEFELVIGDDGSTPPVSDWLHENGGWIHVASARPRNSYAARNRAVLSSRAPVLAFCDADCVPEPEWLEHGLAALESSDVVAGRVRFIIPRRRTVWTLLDIDSSKDHQREIKNDTAETANLFLRRELFDRLGGFEDVIPEFGDFDFVKRAVGKGARLAFAPDVVVWHPARDHPRQLLRAHWVYSHGYGAREGRAGRLPADLRLRALVPVVPVVRSRRWWGQSLGLDRRWLAENGITPTTRETLLALPLMYVVLPYYRAMAQFSGWRYGRRLTRIADERSRY